MATPTPSIHFAKTDVQERVLDAIRGLLTELRNTGGLASLSPVAHLDSDLGLGSLERVELIARLEAAFGVRLPDSAVAEANSPAHLAEALMRRSSFVSAGDSVRGFGNAIAAAKNYTGLTETAKQDAFSCGVEEAQTLLDVLRYRARHDGMRTHLQIANDDGTNTTLTFAEL